MDINVPLKEDSGGDPAHTIASDMASSEAETGNVASEKDVDDSKSVAGRKKMKGGESKDLHSGKESPKEDNKGEKKEPARSKEQQDTEAEMNSILKRGPSMFSIRYPKIQIKR